ncbi:MAG: hydroxyacid dehydrogenase [Candidatus Bathyarchaeia archaeon]
MCESRSSVVFADRVYMNDEAMRKLSHAARIVWANCKSEEDLIWAVRDGNAMVVISEYFPITRNIMSSSKSLRGVVAYGVGYDHIDVEAASEKGIYVTNARGANAESVAEHTFALILSLSRKIIKTHLFVKEGCWRSREEANLPKWLTPSALHGKTIGIIGFGNIGSRVGRIALAYGMRVLVYDPYIPADRVKEAGACPTDLETLMKSSDYVTIHCALSDETRGMIGEDEIRLMKPTAYLINVSRGRVIVEEALIEALRMGRIAGAGLDVFAEEPIAHDNPLLTLDNVVLTPHIAGGSKEALDNVSLTVCEETLRILRGEIPLNIVNRSMLEGRGYRLK